MKLSILILLSLILFQQKGFGQENCECASYNSLQFRTDYEELFDPDKVKNQGIEKAIVMMTGDSSYLEMKFTFNSDGLIISRTWYNRQGKPHSIYEYTRNIDGLITKQTFNYIDSLERPFEDSSPEIIDYTYDSKGRISKQKERDFYGKIRDDSESKYTTYEYDEDGRIAKQYRQYYYEGSIDGKVSKYVTNWIYDKSNLSSTSKTWQNNDLFLTTETTYNPEWKPVNEIQFNNLMEKHAGESKYRYNENNQLVWFSTKSGEGSASECPDGGSFTETYSYGNNGLIKSIEHAYDGTTCRMEIQYE